MCIDHVKYTRYLGLPGNPKKPRICQYLRIRSFAVLKFTCVVKESLVDDSGGVAGVPSLKVGRDGVIS